MSPSPSKTHQRISIKLTTLLQMLVEQNRLGEVYAAPFDVVLSEHDVFQPDILFVSKERTSIVRENGVFGAPDVAVEILSPATAERDRTVKAKQYARAGVKELWLVDPAERTIEVLGNGPSGFRREGLFSRGETARSAAFPSLEFRVDEVF